MKHHDHVNLLRGVTAPGGLWADLGSGGGAFTLALADLIGPSGTIYSIDRDSRGLREQSRLMRDQFPDVTVHYQEADFTRTLALPLLDGVVMANSLHFHADKAPILRQIYDLLKPGGLLLMVEYNADHGNTWVPYPFSYLTWAEMARRAGFRDTRQVGAYPSRFLHEIYSAVSQK